MCYLCSNVHGKASSGLLGRRDFLAAGSGMAASLLLASGAGAQAGNAGRGEATGGGARVPAKGLAVLEAKGRFQPREFTRRPVGDNDILIDVLYSGICHSDVHKVRDDWKQESYPIIPGHEIAGRVVQVGRNVTKFAVGDYAGVGVWIASCGQCEFCRTQMEHLCARRVISFADVDHTQNNEPTNGGHSSNYVVSQNFAIKVPANARMENVAPLLCAGITAYNPVVFSRVERGQKVGVAGFGGLGHMAVKYAVARGAEVTVFDITEEKRRAALKLGAARYVNVNNRAELEGLNNSLNLIIDSIPAGHDPLMYMRMLRLGGEMAVLGLPPTAETPNIPTSTFPSIPLVKVYGSNTGSISQIQQMVDYSVQNNIYPDVEVIAATAIDDAYQRVLRGEVRFRFVIDMKTLA